MGSRTGTSSVSPVGKKFRDGTHRVLAPKETLAHVQPFLTKAGITRIADVTGLDRIGVPVVMVCRPNSRSLSVSQGKGLTIEAARASGLMEAIELFHAEHILSPLIFATYKDLKTSHHVVDVSRLPLVKNTRFHPNLQTLWIEGRDLRNGNSAWVPYECVHASAKTPAPAGSGCFSSTSNGLASGNHILEAILHGICEVIERDAVTMWRFSSRGSRDLTRLDLNSVCDASCRGVIDLCEKADNEVLVWDATSDVGLPVFFCRVVELENGLHSSRSFSGMGCHMTREVALLRALTEAVQSRLTYITGSRDDLSRQEYENLPDADVEMRAEVSSAPLTQLRTFRDVSSYDNETFDEDVCAAVERLSRIGVESVIAVDLTRSEFGIPVVRIVAPGLEGPDGEPEYVPGERARARRAQP